ncbi:MAG: GNAT family N-acetyltransferase [Pseudomonadota bacterium]
MTLRVGRTDDIETCLALRRVVFIEEQGVSVEEEVDGKDPEAHHILATLDGSAIGTARVQSFGTTAKIGRVCVLSEHRGKGFGVALIEASQDIAQTFGATRVILGAQESAIGFYEQLGYRAYGDRFDDADIPHQMMEIGV